MKSDDEYRLFYYLSFILANSEIPNEPIELTDENKQLVAITKAACVTAKASVTPGIRNSAVDIAGILESKFGQEKVNVVKQGFYKCLGCYEQTIRQTAAEVIASIIMFELITTKNPSTLTELDEFFVDDSVNFYMKSGILRVLHLLNYREIITKRYRKYRLFNQSIYEKVDAFLSEDSIPFNEKTDALCCLESVIIAYPRYINNQEVVSHLFELLIALIGSQTEFDKDFHKQLFYVLKALFMQKETYGLINDEIVNALYGATSEDVSKFNTCEEAQKDFITLFQSISKAQYQIIKDKPEDEREGFIFMGDVLEPVITALIEMVVGGEYGDLLNVDNYVLPLHALKCLSTIALPFPDEVIEATVAAYNQQAQTAAQTADNAQLLVSAMCVLQVIIGIRTDETNDFILEKLSDVFELMQSGVANIQLCTINLLDSFIEKKVIGKLINDELFGTIVTNLTPLLSSTEEGIIHRATNVFNTFFLIFDSSDENNFLSENFSSLWELVDGFINHSIEINIPQIQDDAFNLLSSFIKQLPDSFNENIVPYYGQYIEKLQQTLGQPDKAQLADNISTVLSSFVIHLGDRYNERFHPLIQIILEYFESSSELSSPLLYTLAAITYCLRGDAEAYIEGILGVFFKSMESGNNDIISAAIVVLSDLFRSVPGNETLASKAIEIAQFLLEFAKGMSNNQYTMLNVILDAFADILKPEFMSVDAFSEMRDVFMEFFSNIALSLKNIKLDDYESSIAIAGSIMLCFRNVIRFYSFECNTLLNKEEREGCYLWTVKGMFFQFIKSVYELLPFESTKLYRTMLWSFCQFLHEIINVMGRPCNMELNARWTVNIYDYALNSHNTELSNYARSFKRQFDQC
jgi:hypothetical protein